MTFKQCHYLCKEHVNTLFEYWLKKGRLLVRFHSASESLFGKAPLKKMASTPKWVPLKKQKTVMALAIPPRTPAG